MIREKSSRSNSPTRQSTTALSKNELWAGCLPIKLVLAEEDLASVFNPDPVFLLAPRFSYLSCVASEAVDFFRESAIEFSSEAWFDCKGIALRSNLPVGVLYDLTTDEGKSLPWTITVHLQAFPEQKILKSGSPKTSEAYFFHNLKQALHLLHGSTRLFNELTIEKQSMLWEGARSGMLQQYQELSRTLLPMKAEVKLIPIRILRRGERPMIQRPVTIVRYDDISQETHEKTLGEVIKDDFLPFLDEFDFSKLGSLQVQGISVPLNSPIFTVWYLLKHADFFLYVVLLEK